MKIKDVRKLKSGDQVYWTDPDGGICSKTLTVQTLKVIGDMVCITETSGDYLECFAKELS